MLLNAALTLIGIYALQDIAKNLYKDTRKYFKL